MFTDIGTKGRSNFAAFFLPTNARGDAPAHRAKVTQAFLRQNNIPTMQWPAMSADLNPIENFWSSLKNQINKLPNRPMTVAALRREITRA